MKKMCLLNCCQLLLFLSIGLINCSPVDNEDLEGLGEDCEMRDGSQGICTVDSECKELLEAIKKGQREKVFDFTVCSQTVFTKQAVCCPPTPSTTPSTTLDRFDVDSNWSRLLCKGNYKMRELHLV
jgi:hypothetical protein